MMYLVTNIRLIHDVFSDKYMQGWYMMYLVTNICKVDT